MKKCLFMIPVFFLAISMVYTQGAQSGGVEATVPQMDGAVRRLSADLNRMLMEQGVQKVIIGQFSYRGSITSLGSYWTNQLISELTNTPNRSFTVLSGGPAGADWMISGEIIEISDIVRVHTRMIRLSDRSIESSFHSDFERSLALIRMLSSADSERNSSSGIIDYYEPDSWEFPVPYDIGINEHVDPIHRALIDGDDEDFFLLVPLVSGHIVAETSGSIDTYMYLYNYDTGELLEEDDDGGRGRNARIRYTVQTGQRYLAKVRGFSSSVTGSYGFRAWFSQP